MDPLWGRLWRYNIGANDDSDVQSRGFFLFFFFNERKLYTNSAGSSSFFQVVA